jgi:SAM-dependent methyltransferase
MTTDFRNIVSGSPERHDYELGLNCGTFLRNEWAVKVIKSKFPPGADILEIGCGLGWASGLFNSLGFKVLSVDVSERTVEEAKRRYPQADFAVANAEDFVQPAAYDAILAFEVIEHLKDHKKAVENWKKSLRPGGWLFLSTPNRYYSADNPAKARNPHHLREFSPAELTGLFPGCKLRGINLTIFRESRWRSLPVRALFYAAAAICAPFEKENAYAIPGRGNFSKREIIYHLMGKPFPRFSEGLWLCWQKKP